MIMMKWKIKRNDKIEYKDKKETKEGERERLGKEKQKMITL